MSSLIDKKAALRHRPATRERSGRASMGHVKVTILHCDWREGRPRFNPGPRLRALGFTGHDLRDGKAGPWWTLAQVEAWHPTLLAEIRAREQDRARAKPAPPVRPGDGRITVAQLFARMFKEDETVQLDGPAYVGKRKVERRSKATVDGYRINSRVLEREHPIVAASAVDDVTLDIAKGLHRKLEEQRGRANARAIMAVLSRAITWGRGKGLCFKGRPHPMEGLTMPAAAPRLRIGEIAEIEALCAAADAINLPEAADMIYLGVFTGQRQADRLTLCDGGLIGNRRRFVQRKTGAVVSVPETPQLAQRLTAAQERKKRHKVVPAEVAVSSATGKALTKATYRKTFVAVRAAAVAGVPDERLYQQPLQLPELPAKASIEERQAAREGAIARAQGRNAPVWIVAPCPSLRNFTDQDLRDTAVTWLALAGSTIPEIIAVTGHSATAATEILKHYLGRHPELADHAIAKMVTWLEKEGAGL